MTTHVLERSCMFCSRPARRRPAPGDVPAHDFDCLCCGRYRVGETAEARMRGNGISLYVEVLPKITGANKEGYRLMIPSCFRIPFAEEQPLVVVANADRAVERNPEETLAPIPKRSLRDILTSRVPLADSAPRGASA